MAAHHEPNAQSVDANPLPTTSPIGGDFAAFFRHAPYLLVLSRLDTGIILDVNARFEAVSSYPRDEVIGKTVVELGWFTADDSARVLTLLQEDGTLANQEITFTTRHGREMPAIRSSMVAPLADQLYLLSSVVDISEWRAAETALHENKHRLASIFRAAPVGIGITTNQVLREVNARLCELTGYSREELIGSDSRLLYPSQAEHKAVGREKYRQIAERGTGTIETRWRRKDGTLLDVVLSSSAIDPGDLSKGNTFTVLDITDLKRALSRQRKDHTRVHVLLEMYTRAAQMTDLELYSYVLEQAAALTESDVGFFHLVSPDQQGVVLTTWNREALRHCRAPYETHYPLGMAGNWADSVRLKQPVVYNDYAASPNQHGLPEGHTPITRFVSIPVIEGEVVHFILGVGNKTEPYDDEDVTHLQLVVSELQKILQRRRAEEALRESEARWQFALEGAGDGVWDWDIQTDTVYFSPQWKAMIGFTDAEISHRLTEWDLRVHPDDREAAYAALDRHFAGQTPVYTCEHRLRCKDGTYKWILARGKVTGWTADGAPRRMIGTHTDITPQRQAEAAMRRSEEQHRALVQSIPDIVMRFDRAHRHLYVSPNVREVVNLEPEAFLGKTHHELRFPDELCGAWEAAIDTVFATNAPYETEFTFEGPHGPTVFNWRLMPERDDHGQARSVLSISRDITNHKRLEGQLLQAQKMESVGRLAGGVAHDFNNMLTVILNYAEIALAQVGKADALRNDLLEIQEAARRSADLTRQLLAFARKQSAQPRVLNLNEAILDMLSMLRRLVGEAIELTWAPGDELWCVRIDPSQLDQLLANLTVNARDAIGGVGAMLISTANVTLTESAAADHPDARPGEYTRLSVRDTGCGMDSGTLSHIFEPFFTTKSKGIGTGLGLATVYGIVTQNHGFISVESTPGQGTTFHVHLPRTATAPEEEAADEAAHALISGQETVLIVEDEEAILNIGQRVLELLGYVVLTASTPSRALEVATTHPETIHLLVTDVILPEMNGRDLAQQLLALRPEMKCLYMSGYTAEVITHQGILYDGVHFLQKPFSPRTLAEKVRNVLDQ